MGYSMKPVNTDLESFHMGAFLWPYFLDQCGSYFLCIHHGARWYMVLDERMTTHHHDVNDDGEAEPVIDTESPAITCNCGFQVTDEETKVLARIARNYAAIQRTVDKPTDEERSQSIATPDYLKPFPGWIRRDWVDQLEQFAEWAEQSGGFAIW